MNKIAEYVSLSLNKNENYSFSLMKSQALCLNKRVVEIGVGACLAFSTFNLSISSKALLGYSVVGLVGVLQFGGYQGLKFSLLMSTIYYSLWNSEKEYILSDLFYAYLLALAVIGRALVLASSISGLLAGSACIIKKWGSKYINESLNYFNKWQNNVGFLEKDDINYNLTVLGRDILCLKRVVFQAIWVLNCIFVMRAVRFSNEQTVFPPYISGLMTLFIAYNVFGEKIGGIFLLIKALKILNLYNDSFFVSMIIVGESAILTGIVLGAFALLSFLVKKSESGKLTSLKQFLNKLEDKKKVIEYDKDIKKKKLMIEKRHQEIRIINRRINAEINTYPTEDLRSDSTINIDAKQITFPKVKIKRKGNNLDASQSASSAEKKRTEIPTQIEISVNNRKFIFQKLGGTACKNKNVWGVIISDSSNSERYQRFLNNGRIGTDASIRQLKGGGSTFEIGAKMDSRLVGHMYKPEDIFSELQYHLSIENASNLVQAIKENCGKDTSLIIFSFEAKKHQDIFKIGKQLNRAPRYKGLDAYSPKN